MEDGDCTEISAQLIRRHTPCRGGYQPPANVANFWAEPIWPGNVAILQNVPCFDIIQPNFICKCSMVHCRRNAPTLFPQRGNNRADDIRPYECSEITPAVIRWHSPCRVVHRAANQNPMIAGGDHTIMQRISAARQRGKFVGRTDLARKCGNIAKYTMFRHDTAEFYRKMFDTAIVGALRRRCFPWGNNRAADRRPYNAPKFHGGNSAAPARRPRNP